MRCLSKTGTSQGAVTLGGANQIEFLGNFSTGGHSFSLTDGESLETIGTLNTGSAALTLTTTTGGIAVNGTLKGGAVDLVSASTISESGSGKIDATKLTGSSHSTVALNFAVSCSRAQSMLQRSMPCRWRYPICELDAVGALADSDSKTMLGETAEAGIASKARPAN